MSTMNWRENPDEELVKVFKRSELSTFWTSNIDLIIGPQSYHKINDTIIRYFKKKKSYSKVSDTRLY